jgi:hypothetical protein
MQTGLSHLSGLYQALQSMRKINSLVQKSCGAQFTGRFFLSDTFHYLYRLPGDLSDANERKMHLLRTNNLSELLRTLQGLRQYILLKPH